MRKSRKAHSRLLLIAPPNSYRTVAYLEAARRRGVDVLVASEGEHSLVSEIASGLHVDLSAADALDHLLEAAREQPFDGVVATDDTTVELGSRIARALGLPHNEPGAALATRRKDLSRGALRDAAVSIPDFRVIDLGGDIARQSDGFGFPCVVKPLSLSASLVFEQSYGGIDGDSASSAELYALLSALAQVPIKQSLAVTGSVNQYGQIQAGFQQPAADSAA